MKKSKKILAVTLTVASLSAITVPAFAELNYRPFGNEMISYTPSDSDNLIDGHIIEATYFDEYCTAYVYADGSGGMITFNDPGFWGHQDTGNDRYKLFDHIRDVPLKDIIKFADGVYVSDIIDWFFNGDYEIIGNSPDNDNGSYKGFITMTDLAGSTYTTYFQNGYNFFQKGSKVSKKVDFTHDIDCVSDNNLASYVSTIVWGTC